MNIRHVQVILTGCVWLAATAGQALGQTSPTPSAQTAAPTTTPTPTVDALRQQATALMPLVKANAAIELLKAVPLLPEPPSRTIYRNREKGIAMTAAEWNALPDAERGTLTPRVYPPEFFYSSGYGSPFVFARVLDLAGKHGFQSLHGKKVMDFGAGAIGHIRTMALAGASAHGVDVEPVLKALYSEPEDQGQITGAKPGEAWMHIGKWPADIEIVKKVGSGLDLITSKNTLKDGYIHPKPPEGKTVDPKQIITLGVDDATFLKHVHDALKPGGLLVIYNICPAQSDPKDLSKPYIPWADGKSPFSREQFAAAGMEVLELDVIDADWAISAFTALGYTQGASKEDLSKTYFCWYTVAQRPLLAK